MSMMRLARILAAALIAVLLIGTTALAANRPDSHLYDGTASYVLNWQIQSWMLAPTVTAVRSIRFQIVGAQGNWPGGNGKYPWLYVACWFQNAAGNKTLIDEVQVLPKPTPNNDEITQTTDYRVADYVDGLPAPEPGVGVYCGWDRPDGNIPALTYGFARIYMLYSDDG
jgi:hypothetical protein